MDALEHYQGLTQEVDARPCRNCSHSAHQGPCEVDRGDAWVTGNQPGEPTVLMALPPCGCDLYEPASRSDFEND